MFDRGPTQLDSDVLEGGREDATRKLMNRLKFGSESLLITPFAAGVGKGVKALSTRGKDLAFSNYKLERFLGKFAQAFTPEGALTKEVFGSQKVMEGFRSADVNRATELVRKLDTNISKAFPQMQTALDRSLTKKEKDIFLKEINELMFDGDLTKLTDPKKLDAFVKTLKDKGVDKEVIDSIAATVDEARNTVSNLIKTTNNYNSKELKDILQERIKGLTENTYKIFETTPVLGVFGRYRPTDDTMVEAIDFFRQQIAGTNKDKAFKLDSDTYYEEAKNIVERIIEDGIKAKKTGRGLADPNYVSKTLTDLPGGKFIDEIIERTGAPPQVIRKLLGEMKDPRYSTFNAITELSGLARSSAMFKEMFDTNAAAQLQGSRGSFWDSIEAAKAATNSQAKIVKVDNALAGMGEFKSGRISNPLGGMFTTADTAEALKRMNGITEGQLIQFVRGREGASAAEKGTSFLYRNLLLFPKATAQLAKTVLSIPTHLRNIISAGAFAGANGILFEGFMNPKLLGQSFRKGWNISGVNPFQGSRFNDEGFEKAYRELLELGVVNSQVQIGDLKNLMRDVNFGDSIMDLDKIVNPMLNKLKKIPAYLQGKYVAEDDFWKITNYFVELNRRQDALIKDGIRRGVKVDPNNAEFLAKLKTETADIVKNTVPNYNFVGDFVRTARALPVGNFMSFPSEMLRTTTNIGSQALKEMRHSKKTIGTNIAPWVLDAATGTMVKNDNPFYRIGATRISGMAFTLGAVPAMLVEGSKALYNVSKDELDALRQFVPEWSRNSTLIPMRDEKTGELKYVDFSHSNAYDVVAKPFRTLLNEMTSASKDGDTILRGFTEGIEEASKELAAPFLDESIWTEAALDLTTRGGRTREGKVLYTDQTPAGDVAQIRFRHLMEALLPQYKPYIRIGQAALGRPDKFGEVLGLNDQIAGLAGFRPTKVDPLKAMGFKISQYQTGIRNARREFTGGFFGLLRGGPINPNDIVTRFYESNKARFNVQKEMYKNINAAETLGVNSNSLRQTFQDRQLTTKTFNNLKRGQYEPYFPSDDIRQRFREIAKNLGTFDVYKEALPYLTMMKKQMRYLNLADTFDIDLDDFSLETVQTPNLPTTPLPTNVQPNITNQAQVVDPNTNLTSNEMALLSPEEQIIRERLRRT